MKALISTSPLFSEKAYATMFKNDSDSESDTDQLTTTSTITEEEISISYNDSHIDCDNGGNDVNDIKRRRTVSFGSIYVRQYERIVGDHPDTKVGIPLSIGWSYYDDEEQYINPVSLERYESDRIKRGRKVLRMSSITRENMLLNVFRIPKQELIEAEKKIKKIRKQRNQSKNQNVIIAPFKQFGKKIQNGGISLLKGMSYAAQSGMMITFMDVSA
mmetsp:Transcript_26135/g.26571  ORF Transcript_26135/g.26571 Transcript_26135/m.26571 type:complete len:216 (+) Transcript_26135:42-689(+)